MVGCIGIVRHHGDSLADLLFGERLQVMRGFAARQPAHQGDRRGRDRWREDVAGQRPVVHGNLCSLRASRATVRAETPVRPPLPYMRVMDEVGLPPELERCAADAVAEGRYRDRADVVAAGVALLRERDAARVASLASVLVGSLSMPMSRSGQRVAAGIGMRRNRNG